MVLVNSTSIVSQESNDLQIIVKPDPINLQVGEEIQLMASVIDSAGSVQPDTVIYFSRARRSLSVSRSGYVKAIKPGTHQIIILKNAQGNNPRVRKNLIVEVAHPDLDRIVFSQTPEKIYAGTGFQLEASIYDEMDFLRDDLEVNSFSSSKSELAEVNQFGRIKAKKNGKVTITASFKNLEKTFEIEIIKNPVTSLELSIDEHIARTGDVIHFNAIATDKKGKVIADAPIIYSFIASPDDDRGQTASAQIEQDGRFVANHSGLYTIMARNGNSIDEVSVRINPRNIARNLEVIGNGKVTDVFTSDLWVWEGVDGRDYAVTGTWSSKGDAYFWDVTDPSNIIAIDTIRVDARTVNDVKVSEDGRIAVISREGASNRKNGLVILDVTDPSNVEVLSRFDEGLTGGVHNVFIYENHIFAVNNGRKYDIINIEDPKNPYRVSDFELDTPGHAVHDVWVVDGIAYSSNWDDGVVAVDVGGMATGDMPGAGGSLENPVQLGSYTYPSGWNHAAFPFKSESSDKFYIAAGDEAFPGGVAAGWIHFFELDSWSEAKEVARYEVPEAGTHNIWIVDDIMFVAYYQGGLRIVDVSGELMGNLYDQGREIAKFLPTATEGIAPNKPEAWGPQPYKDLIFVSDMNSGLWALKLSSDNETASAE
ncbi:MAG: Ig-like domain-containing protein [Balneolaceae bacterium]